MGVYYYVLNHTTREYLHAHRLDAGLKLGEHCGNWPHPIPRLMFCLMALDHEWKGHRIEIGNDSGGPEPEELGYTDVTIAKWEEYKEWPLYERSRKVRPE